MFLVKSLKYPTLNFNILNFVSTGLSRKLQHNYSKTTTVCHFYFNRIVNLWNALPPIDISSSLASIKVLLQKYFMNYFNDHCKHAHSIAYALALLVILSTLTDHSNLHISMFVFMFILTQSHDVRPSVCHSLLSIATSITSTKWN